MPKAFALQVEEGHGDVADHAGRQYDSTVEIEQVTQVRGEFDQVVGDLALVELVKDGEE